MLDVIGAAVEFVVGLIPDRQPWRGLVLSFAAVAVVGAVVVLLIAAF